MQEQRSHKLSASPEKAFKRLCTMIRGLYPMLDPAFVCPTLLETRLSSGMNREVTLHKRFLRHVYLHSDKLLPFRNLAASRKKILQPGGPYSQEHVATKEGFFSALIYRGVTHNTQFLQDTKTLFCSLDDWKTVYEQGLAQGKDKTYFCVTTAYGSPAKGRQVENVAKYWAAVQDREYTSWLTAADKIDPHKLYSILLRLPAFGSLTAFQLTMDYAECGMTKKLTPESMAKFLCMVDKGGMEGLRILGYQVDRKNPASVSQALHTLQKALVEQIPDSKRVRMGFGPVFMEHTLCKVKRLSIKEFFEWEKEAI
jgi:hypothetical protein